MLVQEGKSNKKSTVLAIVAIVLLISTAGVVYYVYFTEPDVSVSADGVRPAPSIQTTFPTEVLDDPELENLTLYGPAEVTVSERGRKADPFNPF